MMVSEYWSALRWFVAGWLAVSLLSVTLMGLDVFRQAEMTHELAQLEEKLHDIRQKFMQDASYQPDVAFYLSHRARWQQQGVGKQADTQQWDASWLAVQQQWHLPHMQYDIQPSITCEGAACDRFWPGNPMPGLAVTLTTVNLRWSVAHETDILDWLQQLQRMYAGMLLVHGCQWAIVEATDLIAAQCELHLFNFPQMSPSSLNAT